MRRRILPLAAVLLGLAGLVWWASWPQPTGPAAGVALSGAIVQPAERLRTSFRVGTFNIDGCKGSDGRRDPARVADCLADLDFVALNEVHGPRLWERDDQAACLGRLRGVQWLFAPATRDWRHLDFGNGLLTSLPVESWERIPLAAFNGRGYRNAVVVRLRSGGTAVRVLLTHIARSSDEVRRQELRQVIDLYLALPAPSILLGDLNTEVADPEIGRLLAVPGVIDAVGQKLGAAAPPRIDHVVVRGLRVLDAGLRDHGASDHPLAWAELATPQAGIAVLDKTLPAENTQASGR